MSVAVSVFTRDLRLRDNPVLADAVHEADAVVPLFVLDDAIVAAPYGTPNRLGFLLESLTDLDASLRTRGGALVVRRGAWVDVVLQVAREARADTVHVARDVSAYAQRRLRDLERAARTAGVRIESHDAITVVPPERAHAVEWRAVPRVHAVLQEVAAASVAADAHDAAPRQRSERTSIPARFPASRT